MIHKEMVAIQPTLNCLCNLTETPFFVVDLSNVDHVHFERVTFMSKAFDMVLINKDFSKQPWRIDMIPNEDKDSIQVSTCNLEGLSHITHASSHQNFTLPFLASQRNGSRTWKFRTQKVR